MNDADAVLIAFLDAQRARVIPIVEGLSDEQLRTAVVPSGWTPLGMVEHLGHAERHWFQVVALGSAEPHPWPDVWDPAAPYTSDHPTAEVFAFYRACVAAGERVLATTPLSTAPAGRHGHADDQVTDLRFIVLHMIEETARHLGHLDIARELLDGRTELGQDDL